MQCTAHTKYDLFATDSRLGGSIGNPVYTHKILPNRFYARKNELLSTISSLTAGYVTPQFLLPSQLAAIVNKRANDEVLLGTKLPQLSVSAKKPLIKKVKGS